MSVACSTNCPPAVQRCTCGYKQCSDCWIKSFAVTCPTCARPFHVVIVDVGYIRTKYGTLGMDSPESFLSVVTASSQRHHGAFTGMTEFVGRHALTTTSISFSPSHRHQAHYINFAQMMSKSDADPTMRSDLRNVDHSTKLVAINRNHPLSLSIQLHETVSRINSGIIVDLGHSSLRIYIVHDNTLLDRETIEFGGKDLTAMLSNEPLFKKRQIDFKQLKYTNKGPSFIINQIKEQECHFPINLNETMKSCGYQNWKLNLKEVGRDYNNFLSLLPNDIISAISKILDKNQKEPGILSALGWFGKNSDSTVSGMALDYYPYVIGVERFVIMEALFAPVSQDKGLLDTIKSFCEKYNQVKKKIVLCGGMAACPGIVERFRQDLYFKAFEIEADEHYIWKQAASIVKEKQ